MKLRAFALGIFLMFVFASCENPASSDNAEKTPASPTTPVTPTTPETPTTSVKPIFGGSYIDGSLRTACYWQGDVRHSLKGALTNKSCAMATTVSADGVTYAAGWYYDGTKGLPCYWAGDTLVTLKGPDGVTDLSEGGEAYGITVAGGKIFTVGLAKEGHSSTPCYWEGSSLHELTLPTGVSDAEALSIAVSASGTIFIAGYYYDGDTAVPCYWENGTCHALALLPGLSDTSGAYSYSIALDGNDVYICGVCYGDTVQPCYWKNGNCVALDGPAVDKSFPGFHSDARSICVSGGKFYTAGYYQDTDNLYKPCYWEGTTLHALTGGPATGNIYTSAISVTDGVISVAGYYCPTGSTTRSPCYWEGGVFHDLGVDTPKGDIPFPEPAES